MDEMNEFHAALREVNRTVHGIIAHENAIAHAYEALGYARGRIDAARGGTPGLSDPAYLFAAAQVRAYLTGTYGAIFDEWDRFAR